MGPLDAWLRRPTRAPEPTPEPERHFERLFFYYDRETGSSLPQVSACWDDPVARAVSRVVV